MTRSFIITLELDGTIDPNAIAKELHEAISYDFPELVSVKPWSAHSTTPTPIEGELYLGQQPPQ